VEPGGSLAVPLTANLGGETLGAATIEIQYDPAVVDPAGCNADPGNLFDLALCNTDAGPGLVSFTAISAVGVTGDPLLAEITFQAIGDPGDNSPLTLTPTTFADPSGQPISVNVVNGQINIGNTPPILDWTGELNYESDGLHPESGTTSDNYVYRIAYIDDDGDAPNYVRVHIEKGGGDIAGSPFTMSCAGGDYTTGVICSYTKAGLAGGADYTYYFVAEDNQGNPATPTLEKDAPDVGNLDGTVDLQGRSDHSGAEVCAWQSGVEVECTTTDAAGSYAFSLSDGTCDVTVEMALYLDAEKSGVTVVSGETNTLCQVMLLCGDANDDDIINILDLSFMGFRFGLCEGDLDWDPRADCNNDGCGNILDITGAGVNFNKFSPVPWLCP
jgi:hypothetical protein